MPVETEIKFLVSDVQALEQKLRALGFTQETPFTYESNTLYDLPTGDLRRKGEVLRIRRYGDLWTLTHKNRGTNGHHKSRHESETAISDGEQMDAILRALGYAPAFVYEKYRSEWTDGKGEVVIDRTPIGDVAEVEGTPEWIDRTARALNVPAERYITASYAALFRDWVSHTKSQARHMTFAECGTPHPVIS